MNAAVKNFLQFHAYIKSIGYKPSLGSYEKRKLGIFNLMNLMGLLTGLVVPLVILIHKAAVPYFVWLLTCSPAMISVLVLILTNYQRHELSRMIFFTAYPLVTCLLYGAGIDAGIEFFFILYGVMSVFFLQRLYNIIISFSLSMACYFLVGAVWQHYEYQLEHSHYYFFLLNHVLALFFIFYGLLMIKRENARYQSMTHEKNFQLRRSNLKILNQKKDIAGKAGLLEEKTQQLTELNSLKNKLFSVIAHDLKNPIYALRNLFRNIQQYDLPGDEIKIMIPEVVNELTYTTGLMENLLQWAKSQMNAEAIKPQLLDISKVTSEVLQLLRLQAEAKHIYISTKIERPVYVYADKDMINLVLRNLLSNAIKFTPDKGTISIEARELRSHIEVCVQDTGTGISQDNLRKLMVEDLYYSTKGTEGEAGTGLGLMLCKEFLSRNGGKMHVQSEPGKGSIFTFTLPKGGSEPTAGTAREMRSGTQGIN